MIFAHKSQTEGRFHSEKLLLELRFEPVTFWPRSSLICTPTFLAGVGYFHGTTGSGPLNKPRYLLTSLLVLFEFRKLNFINLVAYISVSRVSAGILKLQDLLSTLAIVYIWTFDPNMSLLSMSLRPKVRAPLDKLKFYHFQSYERVKLIFPMKVALQNPRGIIWVSRGISKRNLLKLN